MFNIDKKPEHPGVIANELFSDEQFPINRDFNININRATRLLGINEETFLNFFHGHLNVTYWLAYRLVRALPHTTMEFWLNKQAEYDAWHAWHKQNDVLVKDGGRENYAACAPLQGNDKYYFSDDKKYFIKSSNLELALDGLHRIIENGIDYGLIRWVKKEDGLIDFVSVKGAKELVKND